ncbi:hypothetical protein [Ruminococcus albus]|nr:hypothetical protein [Ruminococcus albus]
MQTYQPLTAINGNQPQKMISTINKNLYDIHKILDKAMILPYND